jgi:hypothetical protein
MSLKELKRLAPWQWESKIATKKHKIGPKGLEEWEQVCFRSTAQLLPCCWRAVPLWSMPAQVLLWQQQKALIMGLVLITAICITN